MGPEPDERELREGRRGTPLHIAAWFGNAAAVAELIKAGGKAALEARSKNGSTPLHWASFQGKLDCVLLLLDAGADIEAKGGFYDSSPLFQAAEMGHVEVCRVLVARGAKLDAPSNKGSTAMHVASWRGRLEAVKFLLDAGAEVRAGSVGDHNQTPLHMAIIHGRADVAIELARRLGPEALSARAEHDLKAVHFAALYGQLEIMRFLLDECRVHIEDTGGKTESTPLYQACEKGHCSVAAELVARGARINARNKHGATPLFIGSMNGHAAVVAQMLEAGADKAIAKTGGFTPLYTAVEHAQAEVVRVLLEYGADAAAPISDGRKCWALLKDEPKFAEVRQLLLNHGGGPVPLPQKGLVGLFR